MQIINKNMILIKALRCEKFQCKNEDNICGKFGLNCEELGVVVQLQEFDNITRKPVRESGV